MSRDAAQTLSAVRPGAPPHRGRGGVVAWLGLALVALNLLVGSILPPPSVAAMAAGNDGIVVCTSSGMVTLDRNGDPVVPGETSGHSDLCVFCLPLLREGLQAPAEQNTLAMVSEADSPLVMAAATLDVVRPARLAGAISPRAPPFL